MSHTRIKFTAYEYGEDETPKGWHLLDETGDGEFTACGVAITESEIIKEQVDKSKITCEDCLRRIIFYKSIKL